MNDLILPLSLGFSLMFILDAYDAVRRHVAHRRWMSSRADAYKRQGKEHLV